MSAEINQIIEKIRELEVEYQNSQGMILTEEDLQCHVFRKIHPLFHDDLETMDNGVKGSQLHSELKFFDDQDKLSIIPDITILDTARLSIFHSVNAVAKTDGIKYEKYRTKKFEFGGNVTVIELKFCREEKGIDDTALQAYKSDIEKINNLGNLLANRSQGMNSLNGLLVIFNKTDKKVVGFEDLMKLESESLKIVYATGKVQFQDSDNYLLKF